MLKNKKQQVFSGTDSNQVKQDNRERVINCNLKIMDNILLSQSDKETSSNHNQYDDDDDNDTTNDKESESELFCFNTNTNNKNNYNKNKIIKNYKNNHNNYKLKSGYVSTSRIDQIGIINSKFNKQLNMIDIVDDQLDDDYNINNNNNNNIIKFNKQQQQNKTENEYLQMAIHYKNLCKSYKKQLIESHKTIRELHLTLEVIERKNWIQK